MISTRIGYDLRYAHARTIIDGTFGSRYSMVICDKLANKLVFDRELDVAAFDSVVLYIGSKDIFDVHFTGRDAGPTPCVIVSDYDLPDGMRKDLVINMPAFDRLGKAWDSITAVAKALGVDVAFMSLSTMLTAAGFSGTLVDQLSDIGNGKVPFGIDESLSVNLYNAVIYFFKWFNGQVLRNKVIEIDNVPEFDTQCAVGDIGCDIKLCYSCITHGSAPCQCLVGLEPPTLSSATDGTDGHCYVVLFPEKCWPELVLCSAATVNAPIIDELYKKHGSNPRGEYVLLKYYDHHGFLVYYHVVTKSVYYSVYKHNSYFSVVSMGSARDIIVSYCYVGSSTSQLGVINDSTVGRVCSDDNSLIVTRIVDQRRRFPGIVRNHYYVVNYMPGVNTYRYMFDARYWDAMCKHGVTIMQISLLLTHCGGLDMNDSGMGAIVRYSKNPVYTTYFIYRYDDYYTVHDNDILVNMVFRGRMSTIMGSLQFLVDTGLISGSDRIR